MERALILARDDRIGLSELALLPPHVASEGGELKALERAGILRAIERRQLRPPQAPDRQHPGMLLFHAQNWYPPRTG